MATTHPTPEKLPALIYDITNSIFGASNAESLPVVNPEAIQVEGLASGTTASIQIRLHSSGTWVTVKALTNTDGAYVHVFCPFRPAYARVTRTGGTDNVVAYAQK